MAEANQLTIFECPRCLCLLPYKSCYHSCPEGEDQENGEDGFQEALDQSWYEEIKRKKEEGFVVTVVGENRDYILDRQVIMILPNEPGKQYREDITGPDIEGSWHVRKQGEQIPQGVEGILMVEVGPGLFRRLSAIVAEEQQ